MHSSPLQSRQRAVGPVLNVIVFLLSCCSSWVCPFLPFIFSLWLEFTLPSTDTSLSLRILFLLLPAVPYTTRRTCSALVTSVTPFIKTSDLTGWLVSSALGGDPGVFLAESPVPVYVRSLNVTCWTRDSHRHQIYNVPSVAFLRNRFQNNINLKLCEYKNNIENLLIVFYGSKWKIYA